MGHGWRCPKTLLYTVAEDGVRKEPRTCDPRERGSNGTLYAVTTEPDDSLLGSLRSAKCNNLSPKVGGVVASRMRAGCGRQGACCSPGRRRTRACCLPRGGFLLSRGGDLRCHGQNRQACRPRRQGGQLAREWRRSDRGAQLRRIERHYRRTGRTHRRFTPPNDFCRSRWLRATPARPATSKVEFEPGPIGKAFVDVFPLLPAHQDAEGPADLVERGGRRGYGGWLPPGRREAAPQHRGRP